MEEEVWQVLRTDEEEKCNLAKYVTQCKEALFKTAAAELNLEKYIVNVSSTKKKESWSKEWKQNALHGQFVRETDCENESKGWEWLRKGSWKGRLKVSFALHKSKLLELTQWSIALTRPVKLHVAGFAKKMLKVSHLLLAPDLI